MGLINSMERGPSPSQADSTKPGSYELTHLRSKRTEPSAVMGCHHGDVTSLQPGDTTPDETITPHDHTAFRGDQNTADSGKTQGGGTAVLVQEPWCVDCEVISRSWYVNVEFLTMRLRPFYLHRELQCIIVRVVYIPPSANEETALGELHDTITEHGN